MAGNAVKDRLKSTTLIPDRGCTIPDNFPFALSYIFPFPLLGFGTKSAS